MNHRRPFPLFPLTALAWLILTGVARAAEVAAPVATVPETPVTIWTPVVIALVPVVLNYGKQLIPERWYGHVQILIPFVAAPLLGVIGDKLSTYATGATASPLLGAGAGFAAVLVRMLVQEVRKSPVTPDSWTPPPPATKAGEEASAVPAGSPPVVPPRP